MRATLLLLLASTACSGRHEIFFDDIRVDTGFPQTEGSELTGTDGNLAGASGITATISGVEYTFTGAVTFEESGGWNLTAYDADPEAEGGVSQTRRWEISNLAFRAGRQDCASNPLVMALQLDDSRSEGNYSCVVDIQYINAGAIEGQFGVNLEENTTEPYGFTTDGYFRLSSDP